MFEIILSQKGYIKMSNIHEVRYLNKYTSLDREQLIDKISNVISENRFNHVLAVEETALNLAKKNDVDLEKTSLAALLHDIAKERSDEEMRDIIISENLDLEMLNFGSEIWHGPTGAVLSKREYGVHDEEILDAIASHTVGETQMSLLTQIIFVADYIEPNRDFKAAQIARNLAKDSLKDAIKYILKETIKHLIREERTIYPKTIETYNAWLKM